MTQKDNISGRETHRIPTDLKELLGEKEYYRYLKDVVYPELERSATSGSIDNVEIKKIADTMEHAGVGILSPNAYFFTDLTRNNYSSDGWIAETAHEVLPFLLNHVIVKSSGSENFDDRVKSHRSIEDVLKGTAFEDRIPSHFYASKKYDITDTPLIDGKLMIHELQESDPVRKEKLLTSFIDNYVDFFNFLNNSSNRERLDFGKIQSFKIFFPEKFRIPPSTDTSGLEELYNKEIGADLDAASKYVMHGDLTPSNIIMQLGKFKHIDWTNAAKNGFLEYDLGSLLKKSNIDQDLEERLVRHAASRAYSTDSEREKSFEVYTKNQITQQLLDAQRYLSRSKDKDNHGIEQKLFNMAIVNFNDALQRTRRAVKSGMLTEKIYDAIVKQGIWKGLKVLSNEELESMRGSYNPNILVSQENLISDDITNSEKYDVNKNLKTIRKEIGRAGRKSLIHKLMLGAAILGVAGITETGIWYTNKVADEAALNATHLLTDQNNMYDNYKYQFESSYKKLFAHIVDKKTDGFDIYSPIVDSVANKYGVPASMARRIMITNKYFAGFDIDEFTTYGATANIFDVMNAKTMGYSEITDPKQNLDSGMKRLSELMKKHTDVKDALMEFYLPLEHDYGGGITFPGSGTITDLNELDKVKEYATKMVYSAINGIEYYDGMKITGFSFHADSMKINLPTIGPNTNRAKPDLVSRLRFSPSAESLKIDLPKIAPNRYERNNSN